MIVYTSFDHSDVYYCTVKTNETKMFFFISYKNMFITIFYIYWPVLRDITNLGHSKDHYHITMRFAMMIDNTNRWLYTINVSVVFYCLKKLYGAINIDSSMQQILFNNMNTTLIIRVLCNLFFETGFGDIMRRIQWWWGVLYFLFA